MLYVPCFYLPKGHQVIVTIKNSGDYKSEDLEWACEWTSQVKLMSIHCHGNIYSKNPGSQPQVTRFTIMQYKAVLKHLCIGTGYRNSNSVLTFKSVDLPQAAQGLRFNFIIMFKPDLEKAEE